MDIYIDPSSPLPLYEQLQDQIVEGVHTETLLAGTPMPTVRWLAEQLGVSQSTVARSYRELAALGIITTSTRRGTRIADISKHPRTRAQRAAVAYAEMARALGLSASEALSHVTTALEPRP